MGAGGQGLEVGADLVGAVAVGGDAVGADDDQIHPAFGHQPASGVVGDRGCKGTPARASSQAVRRPWLRGRVSLTQRAAERPRVGGVDGASAVPWPQGGEPAGVAVGHQLQRAGALPGAGGEHRPWPCSPMAAIGGGVTGADGSAAAQAAAGAQGQQGTRASACGRGPSAG